MIICQAPCHLLRWDLLHVCGFLVRGAWISWQNGAICFGHVELVAVVGGFVEVAFATAEG